jgi:nucleotide-binding universal stress UspA family protein
MVPLAGHPLVVGVVPGQPELVALTAAEWAHAAGASALYFAYADPGRYAREEYPDGTVWHEDLDPDAADPDAWRTRHQQIVEFLTGVLADSPVPWHVRYLAGRADRALTHLARTVDAAGFVVGTRAPGPGSRMREAVTGSVALRLSHHQHRPVLVVPLQVVDWHAHPWGGR